MRNLIILGSAGNVGIKLLERLQNNKIFETIYALDINIEPLDSFKDNINLKIIKSDILNEDYLEKIISKNINIEYKIINLVAKDYPVTKEGLNKKFNNPFCLSTEEYLASLKITAGSTYNLLHQITKLNFYKVDIILVSSIYEKELPDPHLYSNKNNKIFKPIAYSSGKAAQSPLLKQAAKILGEQGGRCNCLSFGGIKGNQDINFIKRYTQKTPQGKMIEMQEVIKMILWLFNDSPYSINGANIMVDGGFSL